MSEFTHHTPIALADYIAGYRSPDRCMAACRACKAFGHTWACPPYAPGWVDSLLSAYRVFMPVSAALDVAPATPAAEGRRLLRPLRREMTAALTILERRLGGYGLSPAGGCELCYPTPCTRPDGHPCRHQSFVRPSLEALGFDVCLTASRLLGFEIEWGSDGCLPARLHLVSGLLLP